MSILTIKSGQHQYEINSMISNENFLAVFCESFSNEGIPENLYALRFPILAQALYLNDNVEDNQVQIPLTVQILEDELAGANNFLYITHKDELPDSIAIRPCVYFNNFLPQSLKDFLKLDFTNPVTN